VISRIFFKKSFVFGNFQAFKVENFPKEERKKTYS